MTVTALAAYDPTWPERYEAAAATLREVEPSWLIEHIGSTSIPGMAAKPIIDLAVRVPALDDLDHHLDAFQQAGWLRIKAGPTTHRVLVRQHDGSRTHIAHFFAAEQWDDCNQRIFRDWLQDHPDDAAHYLAVKTAAAENGAVGRDYTARKTAVVQEITNRARAARGLYPVDVWDK